MFAHGAFSILAVGSFPQTQRERPAGLATHALSVSSLLDRFLRLCVAAPGVRRCALSVSSLLDRFLRRFQSADATPQPDGFQYPRCWIVSSDATRPHVTPRQASLSVSSLLDRFLRLDGLE